MEIGKEVKMTWILYRMDVRKLQDQNKEGKALTKLPVTRGYHSLHLTNGLYRHQKTQVICHNRTPTIKSFS